VTTRLGIRVRAEDAEIAFARLEPVLAAGAEEVELDDLVEFAVYGDALPSDDEVRALAGDAIVDLVRSRMDSGWALAWQDHLTPVSVGAFTIRPPWIEGGLDDLVVDPGPAFGAASHPTTRLCLTLLQESPPTGLADWGAGSGVLAIAGARLGFSPVLAVELDILAAHVARRNAARNGVTVEVVEGDVTAGAPWAPTIVANLTLPLLVAAAGVAARAASGSGGAAPAISPPGGAPAPLSGAAAAPAMSPPGGAAAPPSGAAAARPGGVAAPGLSAAHAAAAPNGPAGPTRLIVSGVLARAADQVVAAWAPLGFSERERRELDGWAALVLERSA
jgi:ribosomal protein L11 methyltransferase